MSAKTAANKGTGKPLTIKMPGTSTADASTPSSNDSGTVTASVTTTTDNAPVTVSSPVVTAASTPAAMTASIKSPTASKNQLAVAFLNDVFTTAPTAIRRCDILKEMQAKAGMTPAYASTAYQNYTKTHKAAVDAAHTRWASAAKASAPAATSTTAATV